MLHLNLFFVTISISVRKKEMSYEEYLDNKRIDRLYESTREKMNRSMTIF
ncbi:YrzI family small protein [Fictibacillus sp. Mic-4]|nr:YrzI family small protein [Fictibacillus gelatini]